MKRAMPLGVLFLFTSSLFAQSTVVLNANLTLSGRVSTLQNTLTGATAMSASYTVLGQPGSLTISLWGITATGTVALLDTYNGTSSTTRTVALGTDYQNFQLLPVWTGTNVSVNVALQLSGLSPPVPPPANVTAKWIFGAATLPGSCNFFTSSVQVIFVAGTFYQCTFGGTFSAVGGGGGSSQHQVNGVNLSSNATINFENSMATNGLTLTFANPSAGNVQLGLSGTLADTGLATAYSGVGACGASNWIFSLSRAGAPNCSQPGFANLAGQATAAQMPATINASAIEDKGGQVFNVKAYGAMGDGKAVYDGTMASVTTTMGASASTGTSLTAPGGTANFANEFIVTAYSFFTTITAPVAPTQRAFITGVSSNHVGFWIGDLAITATGAYTGQTATQTTNPWLAINFGLVPVSGQSISFVSVSSGNSNAGRNLTLNAPASLAAGNALIACVAFYTGGGAGGSQQYLTPAGWAPISAQLISGSTGLDCFSKRATASEPASYTFNFSGSGGSIPGQGSGAIIAYSNVAAIDDPIVSVNAGFQSADVGKLLCASVGDVRYKSNSTFSACDQVEAVLGSNAYALFGNPSPSSSTLDDLRFATNDDTAVQAALAAATVAGGTVYFPTGGYGLTQTIATPFNKVVNITGAGAAQTQYSGNGGTFAPAAISGTELMFLTSNLSGRQAILVPPDTVNTWTFVPNALISDISLFAGAGKGGTGGGGGDGMDIATVHLDINRVNVSNFAGNGIDINDSLNSSNTYLAQIVLKSVQVDFSGLDGVLVSGSGHWLQNFRMLDCEIDNNGNYGFDFATGVLSAAIFDNNIFQWNNRNLNTSPRGAEVKMAPGWDSINFRGNWIENETPFTDSINITGSTATGSVVIESNHFQNNTQGNRLNLTNVYGLVLHGNTYTGTNALFFPGSSYHSLTADASNHINGDNGLGEFATSVTGTSGTAVCHEDALGGGLTTSCFLNSYAQTGTAQTWTFPFPYATVPILQESGGSCGAQNPSVTATVLTLPANAAMTAETCQVSVTGQEP